MAIIRYFGVYRGTLAAWRLSSEFLKSQVLKVWSLLYSASNGVFPFFGTFLGIPIMRILVCVVYIGSP